MCKLTGAGFANQRFGVAKAGAVCGYYLLFLQAEDGIRYIGVTGVQTCALPISTAELGDGWRDGLHPEDRQRYLEIIAAATAARKPWEIEYRLCRADGNYHWLLEHAVPVGAGSGFAGYVGSCTDINARYRETERQMLLAQV